MAAADKARAVADAAAAVPIAADFLTPHEWRLFGVLVAIILVIALFASPPR